MALLDEVIDTAVDDKVSIATLLRKCLVLEQQFHNEKFRIWLDRELDGYEPSDELPSYRKFRAISYGLFLGMAVGISISNPCRYMFSTRMIEIR
jgi:hypothetical protein